MADDSGKKKSNSKNRNGDMEDDEPPLEGYERLVKFCFVFVGRLSFCELAIAADSCIPLDWGVRL